MELSPEISSGGISICRPARMTWRAGVTQGFTLISDVHIGAPQVDLKLFKKELDTALERKDRILINGDLLDMILIKDAKRFSADSIHPRLQGRQDIVNAAIEWCIELLSPYAHLIDMIGVGNHEVSVQKYHSFDPTMVIVYELGRVATKKDKKHLIHYGGYTGFVDYRFERYRASHAGGGCRWVIYYHHGSGGSAPVTKGMINFNRKDTWVDADLIWMGHQHNKWSASVLKVSCPLKGDNASARDVRHVMTGAYFDTYVGQTQASIRKHGRRSNYAADMGVAPQGKGGMRVELEFNHEGLSQVRVIQ